MKMNKLSANGRKQIRWFKLAASYRISHNTSKALYSARELFFLLDHKDWSLPAAWDDYSNQISSKDRGQRI